MDAENKGIEVASVVFRGPKSRARAFIWSGPRHQDADRTRQQWKRAKNQSVLGIFVSNFQEARILFIYLQPLLASHPSTRFRDQISSGLSLDQESRRLSKLKVRIHGFCRLLRHHDIFLLKNSTSEE